MCVFQVLNSERTISSVKLWAGLHLLNAGIPGNKNKKSSFVGSILGKNNGRDEMLLHYRLGHPNFMYLRKLFLSLINKSKSVPNCEICQFSKHTRNTYPTHIHKPTHPFSLIHSDVWGPSRVPNVTGSRWFITFIDDHTRLTWVFFMKEKSEGQIFQKLSNMIQTQFHTKIQVLKTDNGRDFFQSNLNSFLQEQGIVHMSSCVDTPQQNGVAERKQTSP